MADVLPCAVPARGSASKAEWRLYRRYTFDVGSLGESQGGSAPQGVSDSPSSLTAATLRLYKHPPTSGAVWRRHGVVRIEAFMQSDLSK